jgi:site-specific DNA-methyltransferase (adenine-specific)
MEIVNKKIDELKPYENNPRFNDDAVEYVANSIKEFGFKVPIVIDKDNVIVAGHTRYKASLELGLNEVPCIIADDLTEEQIKAFRLVDNKVSEKSSWDIELLDEELNDLDINLEDYGFDNIQIEWDNIDDLTEENYEEPQHNMLECPKCHHIDRDIHFKKVED